MDRSGLMSWNDGFGHKDSRDSPGKAGSSQEMDQDQSKTPGEAQGRYCDNQEIYQDNP